MFHLIIILNFPRAANPAAWLAGPRYTIDRVYFPILAFSLRTSSLFSSRTGASESAFPGPCYSEVPGLVPLAKALICVDLGKNFPMTR